MTLEATPTRRHLLAVVILTFIALSTSAGEIKCATWNMEWFPSGIANLRNPAIEPSRIRKAGDAIWEVSPSILFVQEIRDLDACKKLADSSGTKGMKVAVCSDFRDSTGIPIFQQCAILTTFPVVEVTCERWHSYGIVDPPRGYAYSLLDVGGELVACYCVHLKSNRMRKESDRQMNILKRELAASQLLANIKTLENHGEHEITKFIIAGDFNTTLDDPMYVSEGTIRSVLDAGFKDGFEGLDQKSRITLPTKGRHQDVTFDYIIHKGFRACNAVRVIPSTEVSDHRLVVVTLEP